jgi:hypothetical protein
MKRLFLITGILLLWATACNDRQREQALENRETALNQREQELVLREKTLQLKEEEWQRREKQPDSLHIADSSKQLIPEIIGTWSVKMTCTETTCTGSAVGDIRNEQWHVNFQDNNIIVKAMTGDQLVRVYTGTYSNHAIELVNDPNAVASHPTAKMTVRLRLLNNRTMEGQREIIREENCKIIYAVQMNKQ